jgi:hypothetical protein
MGALLARIASQIIDAIGRSADSGALTKAAFAFRGHRRQPGGHVLLHFCFQYRECVVTGEIYFGVLRKFKTFS